MATYAYDDGVKTIAITSTRAGGNQDFVNLVSKLAVIDYLAPGVALDTGVLTITLGDGRVFEATLYASDNKSRFSLITGAIDGEDRALDKWEVQEIKQILDFLQEARAAIMNFAASVFTVTYA